VRLGLATATAALALAAAPGPVRAAPTPARPRVAVVVDLVASVSRERAIELGLALADALQRELEIDAVGGADVERLLPPGGVPDDCVAAPACLADLGGRLDATQLLLLGVVQVGDRVRVDATWIDVARGEAVSRPRIELAADARAGEVFAAAASRLLPDVPHRPPAGTGDRPPPGPRRHLTPLTWTLGGVAVAALGIGVGFGLSANGTYDRCERDPDGCDDDTRDGIGRKALAADLLMGSALVVATTATILYLRSNRPSGEATAAQSWLVRPTRDGAVAEVRVRF